MLFKVIKNFDKNTKSGAVAFHIKPTTQLKNLADIINKEMNKAK